MIKPRKYEKYCRTLIDSKDLEVHISKGAELLRVEMILWSIEQDEAWWDVVDWFYNEEYPMLPEEYDYRWSNE